MNYHVRPYLDSGRRVLYTHVEQLLTAILSRFQSLITKDDIQDAEEALMILNVMAASDHSFFQDMADQLIMSDMQSLTLTDVLLLWYILRSYE